MAPPVQTRFELSLSATQKRNIAPQDSIGDDANTEEDTNTNTNSKDVNFHGITEEQKKINLLGDNEHRENSLLKWFNTFKIEQLAKARVLNCLLQGNISSKTQKNLQRV